jgi:hypothetical protein
LRAPGTRSGDDSRVGEVVDDVERCLGRDICVPGKGTYGYRRLERLYDAAVAP